MTTLASRIGRRLREERLARQLTQEQLSAAADISVSYLSMLERGERIAHLLTLNALAMALGVSLSQLVETTDDAPGRAHFLEEKK